MKDLFAIMKVMFVEKKDIALSVLCGFIAGITAIGLFSLSGYLISKSALQPPLYTLMILVASVKLLGIISALSRYGERYFSHRGTFTMLSQLRVHIYEKIEARTPAIFRQFQSGDLLARIVGDVETMQHFFLRVCYPPVVLMLVFTITIFFTSFFSFWLTMIILAGFLFAAFLIPAYIGWKQRKIDYSVRKSRGDISTQASEFLYGFRDLKIYQRIEEKAGQLQEAAKKYEAEREREGIHKQFAESINIFFSLLIPFAVLAVGAYFVTTNQLDGVFLAMFVLIALTAFENTRGMAVLPSFLEDNRQAAIRLNSIFTEEKAREWGNARLQLKKSPFIRIEDVSFRFPEETRKTLSNVSLALPPGSKTAIVGPSGSGKSTLMQLMLQIFPVYKGKVYFNEEDAIYYSQESIWENANVVLQENHFFYGTIRDNLAIAKDGLTDAKMQEILAKVKLNHFQLQDRVLEKGANLSGGEKQRLAIARALLKKAPMWFLDEPTSSMDALTEEAVYRAIFEAAKEDTLLLITHRLTGLEKMDQIIVMEAGKIVETGTYTELMEKKGYFYDIKQIERSVFYHG